jgi:hypothetical protein
MARHRKDWGLNEFLFEGLRSLLKIVRKIFLNLSLNLSLHSSLRVCPSLAERDLPLIPITLALGEWD